MPSGIAADPHEQLLEQWSSLPHHTGHGFIADGIIDPARWETAPRRVLFLLKEAYGDGKESWDLRTKIRDEWQGPKYSIWRAAAQWAYAAQQWTRASQPPCPTEPDLLAAALLSCAVVNLKKSDGRSQSDSDNLALYAEADAELLRRQVALIDPDLIICGSTWGHAHRYLWFDAQGPHGQVWQVDRWPVIDFWHPAVQWPHTLQYYALGGIMLASGLAALPQRA